MAILQGVEPFLDRNGQQAFLACENITSQTKGFAPTANCVQSSKVNATRATAIILVCMGHDLTLPDWLPDGEFTLQWSHFAGYNLEVVPIRSLPIYHTCANICISGGVPVVPRRSDWVAPFFGGDQVQVNGEESGPDRCAFNQFASEQVEPSTIDVKNDDGSLIRLGAPEGWAVKGNTSSKRADNYHLPRFGHIARHLE